MQGAVRSCIACGVRYAMCQSTWKSFGDALEMHQKSAEFNTQGHTLTISCYFEEKWLEGGQCHGNDGMTFMHPLLPLQMPCPHPSIPISSPAAHVPLSSML